MREDAQANTFHITETDVSLTLQALQPATTSHHAQMLISTSVQDVSPTLRSETKQSLMSGGGNINVPLAIAYSIDSASSNSWKSSNPNSGIHSANVARTIDAAGTNPTSNQGGNLIASVSPQEQSFTAFQQNTRSEVRLMQEDGSVVGALSASAGMNQQNYVLWEASHGYDPARVSSNQGIVPTLSHKMGTGGNNVPLIGVRRLTPTECEALQGFPRNWTSGQSDTQRYRQLGNAVAVPVAEWIGKRILKQH
jgi:site-specific DNA-cytosine methylase